MTKKEQALEACIKIMDGVECKTMPTSAVLSLCLRIARLLDDEESIKWFTYENGGYPRDKNGYIFTDAWHIAYSHGRGSYNDKGEQVVFSEIVSELESQIDAYKKTLGSYTTSGVSVSGDKAYLAMGKLTSTVTGAVNAALKMIAENERKLAKLTACYYDYALTKYLELEFSNTTASIFSAYRERVDRSISQLSSDSIKKLQALEDKINSENKELYSQALTTCRRLLESVACELFDKYFPNYKEAKYTTLSGVELDITGDHYLNKLSAVIENLQGKSAQKTLVGSNIIYLFDWIKQLHELQCAGVHAEISKNDAEQCIIHTYICLGDILSLQEP